MKKILLAITVVLLFFVSNAQFGAKGGLNLATWAGDGVDEDGKKSLIAPYFGFFYNIGIARQFSFQPELLYSEQGVKYDFSGQQERITANYLNVVPFFRYNTPSGVYIGTGPYLGLLLSAEFKEQGEPDVDIKDDL